MVIQEEDRTKKGHGKKLVITKCQKNGIKQTKTTYLILTLCLFLILLKIKCDTVVQKNELIFLYIKLGSTSNFKQNLRELTFIPPKTIGFLIISERIEVN